MYSTQKYRPIYTMRVGPHGIKDYATPAGKSPVSNVHFHEADSAEMPQVNERGTMLDSNGHVLMRTAKGWSVDMLIQGHSPNELNCVVYDKSGKAHHPYVSFPIYQR